MHAVECPSGLILTFEEINEKELRTSSRRALSNTIRALRDRRKRVEEAITKFRKLQGQSSSTGGGIARAMLARIDNEIAFYEDIKEGI